jgi:phosphatidylinositol alpha-1,6-mannosyltransferase
VSNARDPLRFSANSLTQCLKQLGESKGAEEEMEARVIEDDSYPELTFRTLVLTPSLLNPGGIQRYTRTLQHALEDLLGAPSVHAVAAAEPEVGAGGKLALPLSARLRFAWQAISEAVRWHPNLIICTHLSLGPFGWMVRALTGRPYWVVVHGIESWDRLPLAKRKALSRADRVIVTSAFSREQVVKRQRIDPQRISSLPCTLDETLLNVEPASDGPSRFLSGQQRVVLTVARMIASERYKGHDVVLRALPSLVDKIPDLTYVVAGDGDDRPRLEKLANELGLTKHVIFTGSVSDSELAALYRRSEIFVLPARTVIDDCDSKGEGFGIVFLEAMAFGKPVIGPDYGAPAEIIRDGIDGLLVKAENATSVANALSSLLAAPETARRMGDSGGLRVREQYSYQAFRDILCRHLRLSCAF